MPRHIWRSGVDLRRRLYEILEHGTIGDRTGLIVGRLIVALIITNLVTMTLDSVPALQAQYGPLFIAVELLSLVVFTIEYALRVWVAAEHAPHRHSSERKARWEFVSSPLGVIDLFAVLPFWFALVLPADLRVVLVFRIVRFLKLARYSPAMRSLLDALYNERRALFVASSFYWVRRCSLQASCTWSRVMCSPINSAPFPRRCGGPSSRLGRSVMAMSFR